MFWEVGQTQNGKAMLTNPQAMNSYSYAQDNPITGKDPDGRCGAPCAFLGTLLWPDVAGDPVMVNPDGSLSQTPGYNNLQTELLIGGLALPGGSGEGKAAEYSSEAIAQVEKILGPEYLKLLAQGGERSVLLAQTTNKRVQNLINAIIKHLIRYPISVFSPYAIRNHNDVTYGEVFTIKKESQWFLKAQ